MTVQKMKAPKTQTDGNKNGFQNIQDAAVGTSSKENIPYHKCQFITERILHKLTIISLYQQRFIPQRLSMMMRQMSINMNTIHTSILTNEDKAFLKTRKIHNSSDRMKITPGRSVFCSRNLSRQDYLCCDSSPERQVVHLYDHYAHAKSGNNPPRLYQRPVFQHYA